MEGYHLRALALTAGVWVVSRRAVEQVLDPQAFNAWLDPSRFVAERTLQLLEASPPGKLPDWNLILPDWGRKASDAEITGLKALRGAHLILVDGDAEAKLGYVELQNFYRLRIASIVYHSNYKTHAAAEIVFNHRSRSGHALAACRLFARRLAVVSNRRAARALGPLPFSQGPDTRCETGAIPTLDASGVPEKFDRYMVFEGVRQLAPVRNTHDDIGRYRHGRYSIWDGKLCFTPTDPARLYRVPYWIAANELRNRPLLQYHPIEDSGATVRSSGLDHLFAGDRAEEGAALRPGDVVALVTHALPPGGAERQWVYLALGLKRAGYDVRFIVYRQLSGVEAHYVHLLHEADIPVLALDGTSLRPVHSAIADDPLLWSVCKARLVDDVRYLCRMTDLLRAIAPKAVYVQLDEPNVYVALAALIASVPHIIPSFRNANPSNFAYGRPWYRDAYRLAARSPRVKLSGNSDLGNADYAAWMEIDPRRVACIPNAVDEEIFPRPAAEAVEAARARLGISAGDRVILGVFRLSKEKNPLCFLRTVAEVARRVERLRVLIVGVGPLGDSLAKEVEDRGLARVVTFLGRRDDVNVLMSLANLLLLTSDHEGLPNVVLEAQLMGLPVVATDAGGTREAVEPGASGLICRRGDSDALAAACAGILGDPKRAHAMARAGEAFIRRGFGLAAMTARFVALAGAEAFDEPAPAATRDRTAAVA